MTSTGQDFSMSRGETKLLRFTLTDSETGNPYDLSASIVSWQLLNERSSSRPVLLYSSNTTGLQIVDATGGIVEVTIDSDDSLTLGIKSYFHSIWIHTGSSCSVAAEGTATVISSGPRQCGS